MRGRGRQDLYGYSTRDYTGEKDRRQTLYSQPACRVLIFIPVTMDSTEGFLVSEQYEQTEILN